MVIPKQGGRKKCKVPWTDILPTKCIILSNFALNEKDKLSLETKKYLKNKYEELLKNHDKDEEHT